MKKSLDDMKVGLRLTRKVRFNLVYASHKCAEVAVSGIYKSGKAQEPKRSARPSRLKLIKGLAGNFQIKLLLILSEIHSHQSDASDEQNLKLELEKLVSDTLRVISEVHASTYKVKPSLRKEVLLLRKKLVDLNENFKSGTNLQDSVSTAFFSCVQRTIDTVDAFVVHFDTICDFIWYGEDIPSRPADRALKEKFLFAVIEYSREFNTDKFAPYFWILKHLKMDQNELPPRTYGLWKKQLNEGTFHHFVQPQKKYRQ